MNRRIVLKVAGEFVQASLLSEEIELAEKVSAELCRQAPWLVEAKLGAVLLGNAREKGQDLQILLDDDTGNNEDIRLEAISVIYSVGDI